MRRTTITLTDELALLLEREARRRDLSVSEVARQALAAHFGPTSGQPRRLPFAAIGDSGQHHTARDAEDILASEWGRARDR